MGSEPEQPAQRHLRILILNQPFAPDVVATAQIAKDFADACIEQGHSVTVVASRSLYGQPGAVLPKRETLDGIEVIRVGSNRFGKRFTIGRIFDFAIYYLRAMWIGIFGKKHDVVVCLTTPPYIALVGVFIRMLRRSRVVYWLMDIYPDVMVAHGMLREGSTLHRVLRRLHCVVLGRVDVVLALGRCMKERLVEQGASPESVSVIPVWAVETPAEVDGLAREQDGNLYRERWSVGDRLLVMYAGNFGLAHDVQTFLDAARECRNDDRVRFAFVGGGKRKHIVEAFVREHGLNNCVVEPYQPRERLAELLAAADVHLVSMEQSWWGLVVPSKFFGVMGVGRPVVFIGPEQSEIARLIGQWGCGVVCSPGHPEEVVEALVTLATNSATQKAMRTKARQMYTSVANREVCTKAMLELLSPIESKRGSGRADMSVEASP